MAKGKDERHNPRRKVHKQDDFLSGHGMTAEQQHGAEMRASAVPASDLEGEYPGPGTYTTPGAKLVSRVLWESRMRREME